LIKEIAMRMFQSEVSKTDFSRGSGRRMAGLMFGALVLGCTLAAPAFAGHDSRQDRAHQGRDQRVHSGERNGRGHQDRHAMPAPARQFQAPRFSPPAPVRYQAPSRPGSHQPYRFRDADRVHLQRHYHATLRNLRVDRRPHFAPGYAIPPVYRSQVTVLPQHLRHRLAPPPRGYQVGYYQGYSVVYDPVTFTILSVLDLLTR
jgi:Ni/Co efflux regulator RcnB